LLTGAIQQFEEALKRSPGNPKHLAAIGLPMVLPEKGQKH
jgi:hypothetical protein